MLCQTDKRILNYYRTILLLSVVQHIKTPNKISVKQRRTAIFPAPTSFFLKQKCIFNTTDGVFGYNTRHKPRAQPHTPKPFLEDFGSMHFDLDAILAKLADTI